jgi:hypothetical protein
MLSFDNSTKIEAMNLREALLTFIVKSNNLIMSPSNPVDLMFVFENGLHSLR